jgi:hypothetical protein
MSKSDITFQVSDYREVIELYARLFAGIQPCPSPEGVGDDILVEWRQSWLEPTCRSRRSWFVVESSTG